MPKKQKARKNTKNKNANAEERKLVEADINGQIYGFVEKALGSCFFTVNCVDGKQRRCKVRNRRMRINIGDCIIVAMREFDDANADIIYKYNAEEVRKLEKSGALPSDMANMSTGCNMEDDNFEDVFVFDDI